MLPAWSGCAQAPPPPTVLPTPRPTPTVEPNIEQLFGESEAELVEAFSAEVSAIAEEAWQIATAPCERLAAAGGELPILTTELRITADILAKLSEDQPMLRTTGALLAVRHMTDGIEEMRHNLTACNVPG